jgi:hypothetical protein
MSKKHHDEPKSEAPKDKDTNPTKAPDSAAATEAPPKGDLSDVLDMVERFLPAEAAPLFDLFEKPFTTAKLWAAAGAISTLGPKIDRVLAGAFPSEVPEGSAPHFAAVMPAATRSQEETLEDAKKALAEAELAPAVGATGDDSDPRPLATLNPFLAAALAAVIKNVAAEILKRLQG